MKSSGAVVKFKNGRKEPITYLFLFLFLKGGIINEIPNVLIYVSNNNKKKKNDSKIEKFQTVI